MFKQTTALLALAGVTGLAAADVNAIGEFFGESFETFENVATPGAHPAPLSVFNGTATLDDSLAHTIVIAFNFFGPAGEVLPLGGNLFGASLAGAAVFEFESELHQFGGYVNTVGLNGGGTAVFKDGEGEIIDTVAFTSEALEWTWIGWESDVAFTTVELTGANGAGQGLLFDNMTVSSIPAPSGMAALGLGFLAGARRRR